MKCLLLFLVITSQVFSQYNLKGLITDSNTGSFLQNVNLKINELQIGTSTDSLGKFIFTGIDPGEYELIVSLVGYQTKFVKINLASNMDLNIYLDKTLVEIKEAVILGTTPKFRETPVGFSQIKRENIDVQLGAQEAIKILNGTPNVYVSNQGGGIGEQRLNIRGFDQTNIAVMINGVPINNPENGEIYWSNWAGISDFIDYIDVQRGLSAVPYSTSSIGGNVNIVTNGRFSNEYYLRLKTEFGSNKLIKNSIGFSTKISNGIFINGIVARKVGDGYADQVYRDELTYFLSLGVLANKHTVNIQLFGSPQKHGQRLTPQTISMWGKRGKKFNPDWGYLNGKPLNLRDNEFHNPSLNITHNWEIDSDLFMTNILSFAHGTGGGTVPPWYPELTRTEDGLINFEREWEINSKNIDPMYDNTITRSILALRKGVHKNYWGNLISALKYKFNNFTFSIGANWKYYTAQNYNELKNLLGGDYYIGSGNINDNPLKILKIGDKVDFNADSFTKSYGIFSQIEYKNKHITGYLNLSISNTSYKRVDYFNYKIDDPQRETNWKSYNSSNLKTGINYNINKSHNIYLNIGGFSRAPLSMNVFDYSNNVYENTNNEKIFSIEAGYGYVNSFSLVKINFYQTYWNDKSFSSSFLNGDSTAIYYYNLFGASAKHSGIELESKFKPHENFEIYFMFSYAINKWDSDVDAYVRPESNPTDEIKYNAFTNNLYVGNNPMTISSLSLFYSQMISSNTGLYINPIYNFYGRYYSQFNPELRTNPNDKNIQSWRIPDFYNFDLHIGAKINFNNLFINEVDLSVNIFNILDGDYIIDAIDGATHNSNSALVWFGRERWWSTSLNLTF